MNVFSLIAIGYEMCNCTQQKTGWNFSAERKTLDTILQNYQENIFFDKFLAIVKTNNYVFLFVLLCANVQVQFSTAWEAEKKSKFSFKFT